MFHEEEWGIVAKRYAEEVLREAVERVCIDWGNNSPGKSVDSTEISINEDSILNLIKELK